MSSIESGDLVSCRLAGVERKATYITSRDSYAVVKLGSGYNVGVPFEWISRIGAQEIPAPAQILVSQDDSLPPLSIISTGGTIASRIDYRTGAVTSQFRAEDILTAIPRLGGIARFRTLQISSILSENMTPAIWQQLARAVYDEVAAGVHGVIVTHGTDTISYTAAALSFMLTTPVPVIFVGSQRSADRPSSDNMINAVCSAAVATSPLGEVAVVMHATSSDNSCAIHRATRVRKMHTSRRDAFASIGNRSLGHVAYPSLAVTLGVDVVHRGSHALSLRDGLEERCALVQFAPGMSPSVLEGLSGLKGLVIAGTGLGHVSSAWIPALKDLVAAGCTVVMTSQCLNGRVCDRVYDTGRDLLDIGVIEGEDMLPEVALVKLMWVLANTASLDEAALLMREDLRGEIAMRSAHAT
ncbi:MAG: Glu-tRNA(Gln) amidotransferase subunit GatD [Methanomicrobiales archaeon]|nr:Glu-tRNA(Gln) amidotransferase subunit GatD [Methanomicrobiales archaeon]